MLKKNGMNYFNVHGTVNVILHTYPNARLLIIDDSAANLKEAGGLLARYNAVVDTCLSGAQAVEQVKKYSYDIVFMDYMMPEMDGIETTAAIRAIEGEHFKTIPIIAWTSIDESEIKKMFLEKGFNDFLAKPIDIRELDVILHRWIPKEKRQSHI